MNAVLLGQGHSCILHPDMAGGDGSESLSRVICTRCGEAMFVRTEDGKARGLSNSSFARHAKKNTSAGVHKSWSPAAEGLRARVKEHVEAARPYRIQVGIQ